MHDAHSFPYRPSRSRLWPAPLLAAVLVLSWGATTAAGAAVQTRDVQYRAGDSELSGMLAWDDALEGPRPGVLVVHEWWGHNEHAREQARRLARAGYVAFALDMFGGGRQARHPEEARAFVTEVMSQAGAVGARFDAAHKVLMADPHVDPERISAIGYCFGGNVVLGMARSGAALDAVASFHGGLTTSTPAEAGAVRARILVLHGAADASVPPEDVAAFEREMEAAGADFRIVQYPGARHGFTNPEAGEAGLENLAYDAAADEASWQELLNLLAEVYPAPEQPEHRPAAGEGGEPVPADPQPVPPTPAAAAPGNG